MLVYGALELAEYAVILPPGGFNRPIIDDAVLEATLVHVRLLDEFLDGSTKGKKYNIKARHWCSGWRHAGFLDDITRGQINSQVAHLSRLRVDAT